MISVLASPAVCVIDDEEDEYRAILQALNEEFVSAIHITGTDLEKLPERPFTGLRLVFMDLHLAGMVGKDAAAHAANVFLRTVSTQSAPMVVVIWSKYGADRLAIDAERPTEADLFKRTLLEAQQEFKRRLIFVEMRKLGRKDRPERQLWVEELKRQINEALRGHDAIKVLWEWESSVKSAGIAIGSELTGLAGAAAGEGQNISEELKLVNRLLAAAQAEGDLSPDTAPNLLSTALSQLLVDQLEQESFSKDLAPHGGWLAEPIPKNMREALRSRLNALLLTSALSRVTPYLPGVIYRINKANSLRDTAVAFAGAFGGPISSLMDTCIQGKRRSKPVMEWRKKVLPIAIEISPVCDVAQRTRRNALLIAGLIVPSDLIRQMKAGDAWISIPRFELRWSAGPFGQQDAALIFCSRYKATIAATALPDWLHPWFRLREMPASAIRNWHSSSASRIGFVSL